MIYEDLRAGLFSDIPYPDEITALIGDVEPWRAFCRLPLLLKQKFSLPDHQQGMDPGYVKRSKAEGREDKEYFHIYADNLEYLAEEGLSDIISRTPELATFFNYASEVYTTCAGFALEQGREIGREVPALADVVANGRIKMVLRFLHYTPSDGEQILAAQHYDRSLYTLHLYESKTGLQFLDWDLKWRDAPIEKGITVVFSGYRLERLTEGRLQKTWHRVVQTPGRAERYSAVLFVWTDVVESYDRAGRSQNEVPSYAKI